MLPPIMSAPPTPSIPASEENNPATTSENSSSTSQLPQVSSPKNPAGISIISRFPNSRNEQDAKGHNLAETAKRTSSPPSSSSFSPLLQNVEQSSKILHDFQVSADRSRRRLQEASTSTTTSTSASSLVQNPTGNRAALNRLTDSTAVLSRSLADSSSSNRLSNRHLHHFINRHHHHHNNVLQRQQSSSTATTTTTATASTSQQAIPEGDIQCNEISSSDDDSTPTKGAPRSAITLLPPTLPARKGILKESRLSRELSALQIDNPHVMLMNQASHRHRKRSHSANKSDAENEDVEDTSNRSRRLRSASGGKPLSDVELKCRELNTKIRNIERKVAQKTHQLDQEVKFLKSTLLKSASSSHFLRSSTSTPTIKVDRSVKASPPRSLRPRSGLSTPVPCSSPRKRKLSSSRNSESPSAKSPRRSLTSVPIQKKPIMTRSRKARVLQLKK